MTVLIVDYGLCNLNSIKRAVEEIATDTIVSSNPDDIKTAERIILPGVGAFGNAMKNLNSSGWSEAIKNEVSNFNIPILGICLGMQLFANSSEESPDVEGLGLISGNVKKLQPKIKTELVPHVGWNEIQKVKKTPLTEGIISETDFYFVHSYHFICKNIEHSIAETPYCGKFTSIIQKDNIYGTQFHPEKSSPIGFKILKNFIEVC